MSIDIKVEEGKLHLNTWEVNRFFILNYIKASTLFISGC